MQKHFIGSPINLRPGVAVVILGLLLAFATWAHAGAPRGYLFMCVEHPDICRASGAEQIEMSVARTADLKRVNREVNRKIRPLADGAIDVWSIGVFAGDCEEYVLAKRAALIDLGFPSAALRIALVKTRTDEGHAVLLVRTDRGQLALDNLTDAIRPLGQTGYRVLMIQTADPLIFE